MKLPLAIHQARLGSASFDVIRPAHPPAHAVLVDHNWHLDVYLDADEARLIGGLWTLAAMSPRSLIHLPLRTNHLPDRALPEDAGRRLDLVLLHHSLQFAPSRWKEVRSKLGPGRPHTVTLPDPDQAADVAIDHRGRHYRENRDLFHQHIHAETLFMTGSAKVFRETASHFHDVARNGPGFVPPHENYLHYCTELHSNDGVLGNAREMHIEHCDAWPT